MEKNRLYCIIAVMLILTGFGPGFVYAGETRTVTDMIGRTVEVPSEIKSVLCTAPPACNLVYMVAPDQLSGWNSVPAEEYIPEKYQSLPVIGSSQGTKQCNYELILSMHPDIFVTTSPNSPSDEAAYAAIEEQQEKLGSIPVVAIKDVVKSTGYSEPIRFTGQLLGEEKQAEAMIEYYERVLSEVRKQAALIPDNERVRVYYASDITGLQTALSGSYHTELIDLCGGINVAESMNASKTAFSEVSREQIIRWDPEVILAANPEFYASVQTDPVWQDISAVKTGRVYLIPHTAYSWFDMPPGPNQIIGIPWTAKTLYPDYFQDLDLESLVREYHEIFIHESLSDDQIRENLNP